MNQRLELRRLARDSSYNMGRQGLAVILGMGISILLARGLGSEARGVYALAVLLPDLLVTFFNLGIGPATIYLIGRKDYEPAWAIRQNIALAFWVASAAVIAGGILALLAGDRLFPGVPLPYLFLGLFLIPISLLLAYLNTILQGLEDFRMFNLVGLASQVLLLALVIVLVTWLKLGVPGALLALLGGNLGGLVFLLAFLERNYSYHHLLGLRVDREYTRHLLNYGLKAHLGNILAFLNYRADYFLLNFLTGPIQVGLYSVAVGLGERLWIPSTAIGAVILPRIASLSQDEEARKQLTPLTARSVFWLSLLLAVAVGLLAEWAIVLLYSAEFRPSALALRYLLPGIVMFNMTRILSNDIAGRGRPELNLLQSIAALAVNLTANLFFIPRWGAAGAALSSAISYSFLALLTMLVYHRLTGVPFGDILLINRADLQRFKKAIAWFWAEMRTRRKGASQPPAP